MFELESDLYLVWDIVTWTARRSNHSILNKINPWKEWCWSWNSNTLATSCEELAHWKRPWCWEGLGAGEEGDDRGWDGWMASPTWWTWVWVNSGSWWWTGRPGVLRFMGSQSWTWPSDWTDLQMRVKHIHIFLKFIWLYVILHCHIAAAAAKLLQSCPTLCNPIDGSPPGSPVPGILQARTLEWVAISFSNEWKWKVKLKSLSHVRLLATPWTAAHQAPPSMGFSRQEYWSGVPLPSPQCHIRWLLIWVGTFD